MRTSSMPCLRIYNFIPNHCIFIRVMYNSILILMCGFKLLIVEEFPLITITFLSIRSLINKFMFFTSPIDRSEYIITFVIRHLPHAKVPSRYGSRIPWVKRKQHPMIQVTNLLASVQVVFTFSTIFEELLHSQRLIYGWNATARAGYWAVQI